MLSKHFEDRHWLANCTLLDSGALICLEQSTVCQEGQLVVPQKDQSIPGALRNALPSHLGCVMDLIQVVKVPETLSISVTKLVSPACSCEQLLYIQYESQMLFLYKTKT